jgi:hypothetical protein
VRWAIGRPNGLFLEPHSFEEIPILIRTYFSGSSDSPRRRTLFKKPCSRQQSSFLAESRLHRISMPSCSAVAWERQPSASHSAFTTMGFGVKNIRRFLETGFFKTCTRAQAWATPSCLFRRYLTSRISDVPRRIWWRSYLKAAAPNGLFLSYNALLAAPRRFPAP